MIDGMTAEMTGGMTAETTDGTTVTGETAMTAVAIDNTRGLLRQPLYKKLFTYSLLFITILWYLPL